MNTILSTNEIQDEQDTELRFIMSTMRSSTDKNKAQLNYMLDEQRKSIEELQDSIKELQDSIAKHHRTIAAIQAHRNSLVPTINSILLTEILAEIFLQLVTEAEQQRHYRYSWIKVAHVCRYWRDVVLSCPRLFSYIRFPTRDDRHLEEFLRLSTTTPLTLYADEEPGDAWVAIAPHLPRTQSLTMTGTIGLPVPWPYCPQMTSLFWETDESEFNKPDGHVVRQVLTCMPNLRGLQSETHLLGVLWFKMPLASTLTSLCIIHNGRGGNPGSLEELGAALSILTSLNTFSLECVREGFYQLSRSSHVSCPQLPHLQMLRLHGTGVGLANMLKLPFHSTAVEVKLHSEHEAHPTSIFPLLTTVLRSGPQTMLNRQIRTYYINIRHVKRDSVLYGTIRGWEGEDVDVHADPPILALFFSQNSPTHFFDMYDGLTSGFRPMISETRVLVVDEQTDDYSFRDSRIIAQTELEITRCFGLAEILDSTDEDDVISLPHLRELRIRFMDNTVVFGDLSLKALIRPLSNRLERGHKLETLIIVDMGPRFEVYHTFGQDIVKSLSAVVGRVKVRREVRRWI